MALGVVLPTGMGFALDPAGGTKLRRPFAAI
jgi:hypothetical protein